MRTSSKKNAYQLNKELNLEFHGRHQRLEKKSADVKIAPLRNRRNPTNINNQKAQNVLAKIYLKEQTEYIRNQINKIRDSVEDRQSRITWQTVNEVSRRNSTAKPKLKAARQEERIYLRKQHFENLLEKPPEVMHESTTKIISIQLDIKLGQFTQKELDSVLAKDWSAFNKLPVIWKSDMTDKIKRSFFPNSGRVDTAIWMHNMDAK